MEAAFYDLIHAKVFNDKSSHFALKVGSQCGIDRIIWSVWDYIIGPESKFIWDINSDSATPTDQFSTCGSSSSSSWSSPPSQKFLSFYGAENAAQTTGTSSSTTTSKNSSFSSKKLSENTTDKMTSSSATNADQEIDSEALFDDDDFVVTDTDTRYAAIYSLSSEIFKSRMGNTSEFKLISAPDRHMSLAAYVYTAQYKGQRSRFSISMIFDDKNLERFLAVKRFTDPFFNDFISRLKAASTIETDEELLTRMSNNLTEFLNVLSRLNSQDGCFNSDLKVSESLFSKADLCKNYFLHQAISTHLQCQGRSVVFGSDLRSVNKVVKTLAMFLPKNHKKLCLLMSPTKEKNIFCPYLMVQGLPRDESSFFAEQCVYSPWPICAIDLDKKVVHHTLPLGRHLNTRLRAIRRDLSLILGENCATAKNQPIFGEFVANFSKDTFVANFLTQMDFLPYEESARSGFIGHFNALLLQYASALNACVKLASDQGRSKKSLKLTELKVALKLETRGDLAIILATADRHQPGLGALFI